MATSNFKIFDQNKGNIMADVDYLTNDQRLGGVVPGKAISALHNKIYYQASIMAAAIAQFVVTQEFDATDEDFATLTQNIYSAIAKAGGAGVLFWQPNYTYKIGDIVFSKKLGMYRYFYCKVAGNSNYTEPTWADVGEETIDSTVTWVTHVGSDARTLGGATKDDIIIPVGSIIYRANTIVPSGFLKCDGSAISRTTYAALYSEIGTVFGIGNGSTTFNLPDLRGEFIRGWDNGRGVDSGRVFGSNQGDTLKLHGHPMFVHTYQETTFQSYTTGSIPLGSGGTVYSAYTGTPNATTGQQIGGSGGTETRPRNIALTALIKY
ncbi:Phage Tail Collar Domain protein [Sporomusa ovata DSM 2662]|nr:tail fiber protein [Sporomusa ovata]EQB28159.1 hypothetical protein SOV_2c10820 [Sporomusa ovata DSM 2662]